MVTSITTMRLIRPGYLYALTEGLRASDDRSPTGGAVGVPVVLRQKPIGCGERLLPRTRTPAFFPALILATETPPSAEWPAKASRGYDWPYPLISQPPPRRGRTSTETTMQRLLPGALSV